MEIFKILQRKSKVFYLFLTLMGFTNAIWSNSLLVLISNKIAGTPLPFFNDYDLLVFVGMIVTSFFISRLFQSFMLKLSIEISYDMVNRIFNKLRYAAYEKFIKFGKEKVYSLLSDTQIVSDFPQHFIEAFNSLVLFLVGISYLFYISFPGGLTVFLTLTALGIIYYYKTRSIIKYVSQGRELSDIYHRNINDLISGFKEIKMSSAKANNLCIRLDENRRKVKGLNIIMSLKWMNNDLLGRYFWFITIGLILFVLPHFFSFDAQMISSFIVTLLFLMGPVGALIGVIPYYSRIKVAISKLSDFDKKVDLESLSEVNSASGSVFAGPFSTLRSSQIEYEYHDKEQKATFSVHIENFLLRSGETVFVTGGNGSGKTTFLNIIVGLFRPDSGSIYFNDILVDDTNYIDYRDKIAVIFADNFMFSENYENIQISEENQELISLIDLLQMTNLIKIDKEKNKLDIELSKGQQKRLSMIYALLENKDILVLDEWAADQDPIFRKYFYNHFLKRLKKMGKTIVIVTHDDLYYGSADRIVRFDFGRITKDELVNSPVHY